MDEASNQALILLTALEERREKLLTLANEFRIAGADNAFLSQGIGCRPFTINETQRTREVLGIIFWDISVTPGEGKPFNLDLSVLRDNDKWLVTTGVWSDGDDEGQDLIQGFPERYAATLEECWVQVDAAISDLFTCKKLLTE